MEETNRTQERGILARESSSAAVEDLRAALRAEEQRSGDALLELRGLEAAEAQRSEAIEAEIRGFRTELEADAEWQKGWRHSRDVAELQSWRTNVEAELASFERRRTVAWTEFENSQAGLELAQLEAPREHAELNVVERDDALNVEHACVREASVERAVSSWTEVEHLHMELREALERNAELQRIHATTQTDRTQERGILARESSSAAVEDLRAALFAEERRSGDLLLELRGLEEAEAERSKATAAEICGFRAELEADDRHRSEESARPQSEASAPPHLEHDDPQRHGGRGEAQAGREGEIAELGSRRTDVEEELAAFEQRRGEARTEFENSKARLELEEADERNVHPAARDPLEAAQLDPRIQSLSGGRHPGDLSSGFRRGSFKKMGKPVTAKRASDAYNN